MNNLKNYFVSPVKSQHIEKNHSTTDMNIETLNGDANATPDKSDKKEISNRENGVLIQNTAIVGKLDNRKITQNMEEVLNSVKKRHRHKHMLKEKARRSKNKKKNESEDIMDISKTLNSSGLKLDATQTSTERFSNIDIVKLLKSPTKENFLNSHKKSKKLKTKISTPPEKSSDSIRNHFSVTPKKVDISEKQEDILVMHENSNKKDENMPTKNSLEQKGKTNAFVLMMNARNRSIGGNSPGKEENLNNEESKSRSKQIKRKLMMEEWAERKGGRKRKLEEDAREEYIKETMKKRAKRLKTLLVKDTKKKILPASNKIQERSQSKIKKSRRDNQSKNLKSDLKVEEVESADSKNHTENDTHDIDIKIKRTRGRPRKRLISEDKSVDCDSISKEKDDDFIGKLSSPIKKRDSLFGYFPKTSPSSPPITPKLSESKKLRQNNLKKKISNSDTMLSEILKAKDATEKTEILDQISTPSGRPRRSCTARSKYDYDLEPSPTKPKKKSKIKQEVSTDSENSCDIIILDTSLDGIQNSTNDKKHIQSKKLAPLFVKAVPKPNLDPETVRARQEFLMSGVPDKMKLEIAKNKLLEKTYTTSYDFFPKYNHVPLWDLEQTSFGINWKKCKIVWRNTESDLSHFQSENITNQNSVSHNLRNLVDFTKENYENPKLKTLLPLVALKPLENKRSLVKMWKTDYNKFPTYKCYNQMREKYRYFSAMDATLDTLQVSESLVVSTRRTRNSKKNESDTSLLYEDAKPPAAAPNGELLFSEKYKPLSSEQILVNSTPINALKEYLSAWQNSSKNISKLDNSLDSFDIANDSNSNCNESMNSIVLVGPNSSGKTNAVFALADELNFNVLEINAGMKRTGKKLLQELHEATQSHQIRKDSKNNPTNLLKKSLSGIKSTKKNSQEINGDQASSSSSDLINNEKLSLILVEDADIIFDQHDHGFTDAIYQLAATSKRPVVIIANNKNCPHLLRLINQNHIEFSQPNVVNISKFLSILALMENCPIELDVIVSLYLFNKQDLRKTISEMQFFIQSGGDRIFENESDIKKSPGKSYYASPTKRRLLAEDVLDGFDKQDVLADETTVNNNKTTKVQNNKFYVHKTLFEFYTDPQNIDYKMPIPINFNLLWTNLNNIFKVSMNLNFEQNAMNESSSTEKITTKSLDCLVDFYENISIASNLSMYVNEDKLLNCIEEEIVYNLVENSISKSLAAEDVSYNLFEESSKQVENILPYISSSICQRTQKSVSLDYEPMLRSICRSEKARSSQERRGSRFYHYLRNSCTNLNTFSTDLFDNTCTILMDETGDIHNSSADND